MGYIVTTIMALGCAVSIYNKKKIESPGVLFTAIWVIVCFFASLRLFDINKADVITWLVILVGVISFGLGTNVKIKSITERNNLNQTSYISKSTFWILTVVLLAFSIKDLRQSLEIMSRGYTLGLIRSASYGIINIQGYDVNRDFLSVWIDYFRDGLQVVLVATGIEFFIFDYRKNKKYLIAAAGLVLIEAFTTGGRWGIAYFIIELFVCYKIYCRRDSETYKINVSRKSRNRIFGILGLLVISIFVVSSVRGLSIEDSLSYYYAYLCGCVPLLDIKINVLNESGIYSFGFGGFFGIISFVIPILFRFVLGEGLPQFYQNAINEVITGQTVYDIGGGRTYNAFVTSFYYLYADFRWLGVMMGMLLFGVIAGHYYRKATTDNNTSIVPYLIISQMMIKSIQIYPLSSQSYFALFIIMFIIERIRSGRFRIGSRTITR